MNWTAPRMWEGETAVILAGGPSLRGFDATVLWSKCEAVDLPTPRIITINNSWALCNWADIHYFCDQSWMAAQKAIDLDSGKWVKGGEAAGVDERVKVLRFTGQLGFDADPACLRHGSNSGYQSIHLATHLGASRILLLGYDMKTAGKQSHWHNEPRLANMADVLKRDFLPLFQYLVEPLKARGIEVINCTPGSALKCWPQIPLEEALSWRIQTPKLVSGSDATSPVLA